jgi:hypothetical protein
MRLFFQKSLLIGGLVRQKALGSFRKTLFRRRSVRPARWGRMDTAEPPKFSWLSANERTPRCKFCDYVAFCAGRGCERPGLAVFFFFFFFFFCKCFFGNRTSDLPCEATVALPNAPSRVYEKKSELKCAFYPFRPRWISRPSVATVSGHVRFRAVVLFLRPNEAHFARAFSRLLRQKSCYAPSAHRRLFGLVRFARFAGVLAGTGGPKCTFFDRRGGRFGRCGPSRVQKETLKRADPAFFGGTLQGRGKPRGGGSPHAPSWGVWGACPPLCNFWAGDQK